MTAGRKNAFAIDSDKQDDDDDDNDQDDHQQNDDEEKGNDMDRDARGEEAMDTRKKKAIGMEEEETDPPDRQKDSEMTLLKTLDIIDLTDPPLETLFGPWLSLQNPLEHQVVTIMSSLTWDQQSLIHGPRSWLC
jgi:hypothetical protein